MLTVTQKALAHGATSTNLALAIIPAILLITVASMYVLVSPLYAGAPNYDYDPAYIYLLNAMSIMHGYVPGHIDHPGTPVQILSGAILAVTWFLARLAGQIQLDFDSAILDNPEFYLRAIACVFLVMNVSAIFYLGYRIQRATHSLLLALVVQVGFVLFAGLLPWMAYAAPEAILIFSAAVIMAILSDILFAPQSQGEQGTVGRGILTGFLLALGLTAKVTFLPLLLLIFVLPTTKEKVAAAASFISFAVLMLLPMVPAAPRLIDWLTRLISHTGEYGGGPSGFIDAAAIPARVRIFLYDTPPLFVALGACFVVMLARLWVARGQRRGSTDRRIAGQGAIFCAILIIQLLMVVKHFSDHADHYILPALSIAPVVFGWAIYHGLASLSSPVKATITGAALAVATLVATNDVHAYLVSLEKYDRQRDADLVLLQQTLDRHPNAIIIGCYRVRERGFAIQFGIGYVAPAYAARLAAGRPGQISYNRFNDRLYQAGAWRELMYLNQLIAQGHDVLLVLPDDVALPSVRANLLVWLPGRERILQVIHVDE